MQREAFIVLEDGSFFHGYSEASHSITCAEVVFNTAMSGYQEVCTDPSYVNQIVVFTTSHIGNVGANDEDCESSHIWIKGVVAREMSHYTSNWRAKKSFLDFLNEGKIPWIEGVDTRKLVRHLQQHGSLNGCLVIGTISPLLSIQKARDHQKAAGWGLFQIAIDRHMDEESEKNLKPPLEGPLVCVYDFGVKLSILNNLKSRGCRIRVVPGNAPSEEIISLNPQGVVLSNGPGDPSSSPFVIENVKKLIRSRIPLLGICFGCQLLGIASGGKTTKMKFGHHGINHPIYDLLRQRTYITSQNHNFMVDRQDFPDTLEITHISLFDGSIQGFRSKEHFLIAFQGHPEGSPGPQDIGWLFDEFSAHLLQGVICH